MAKTKGKTVDVKTVVKNEIMDSVAEFLKEKGYEILDGVDYGFTKGTIVVRTESTDVQLKPITPKSGLTHYTENEGE